MTDGAVWAPKVGEAAWAPGTDEAVWTPKAGGAPGTDEAVCTPSTDEAVAGTLSFCFLGCEAPEAGEAAAEVLPFMIFCFEDEEEEDMLREARTGASNAEE